VSSLVHAVRTCRRRRLSKARKLPPEGLKLRNSPGSWYVQPTVTGSHSEKLLPLLSPFSELELVKRNIFWRLSSKLRSGGIWP
jgi:hypothetical protein